MKIPAAILSLVMTMATFYLMGAFVGNSFDISNWNSDGRFFCVMLGFIFGCVAGGLTYNEMEKGEKK